jgi:hypothetical protein
MTAAWRLGAKTDVGIGKNISKPWKIGLSALVFVVKSEP